MAQKVLSFLDSEAEFKRKIEQCGLGQYWDKFVAKTWTTYARFCFAPSAPPGTIDEASFRKEVVLPILGSEDAPDIVVLRRVYYDAYNAYADNVRRSH